MQLICLKDLESEAPVLNSEFCIRGLEGRLTFFFGHLLAEIFGAISLCSFWKGRLKENHLSAVTGRGVDRIYIYIYPVTRPRMSTILLSRYFKLLRRCSRQWWQVHKIPLYWHGFNTKSMCLHPFTMVLWFWNKDFTKIYIFLLKKVVRSSQLTAPQHFPQDKRQRLWELRMGA
jgi:hypothetical protein